MTGYRLTPRAQADLDDIADFTATRWGARQAKAYIRQIHAAVETVAATPVLARPCDHIKPGYRKFPAGEHVIFFRPSPYGIDVMRILHSHLDFERHL